MPREKIYWNPQERAALEHAHEYAALAKIECYYTLPVPSKHRGLFHDAPFFASLYASTAAHIAFCARPDLREA